MSRVDNPCFGRAADSVPDGLLASGRGDCGAVLGQRGLQASFRERPTTSGGRGGKIAVDRTRLAQRGLPAYSRLPVTIKTGVPRPEERFHA